ncbi:MAG: ATP phosphoribosyltransferase [Candidatus Pacebacteria bacterium]|nr:ATP phosphoribosyltransferase [Candidatus Paceibacterota bacterium]MDD3072773.1 ATP phosphoribosyltransferase [Candidatus Paceibacterota bacterium]MDD4897327.1 ATP phosphoribosyltransferase [Candidatus Paceibacterota bacterium]MDD5446230.1 ATP phosphoribosyltransferase [Candidatus Paceibacterota bacterium]
MTTRKIKIGIPKGSLQEHTLKIFKLAGFNVEVFPRSYVLGIDDLEIEAFLIRPQEIPKYVERGNLDVGISGEDWIIESNAKVEEVCDLEYAKRDIKKVKWVLAVSNNSNIKKPEDLEGKLVSSEVVNIAKKYFRDKKVKVKVEFSWGATEVKPPLFADGVIDLVETGESIRAHNLKVLDVIFESSTKLVANKKSLKDKWKKEKIKDLSFVLKGAVKGEETTLVSFHVLKDKLEGILKILPSRGNPSITKITGTSWYDVTFIMLERDVKEFIPKIKRKGGEGIVEFPLNKAVR